jgi:ABC-type uncharacterized transport system involved in gliding motility auxiliary subunit
MNANTRNVLKLILATVGFFTLLVVIQAILSNHNGRIDLTPTKKFSLSERTQKIVRDLKKDVEVKAFINPDRPENFFVEDLLGRMAALSPHFRYKLIEINRNPALARQYNATQYGTLVFESDIRKTSMLSSGENALASSLLQVTRRSEKIIYFLTGHGEADLQNSNTENGYTKLRGALGDEFYQMKILSFAEKAAVPDDAAVVVLLGPRKQFLPPELEALAAYVKQGGALFVLIDPDAPASLISFLEPYGLYSPPLVAVDPAKRLYASEILTFRVSATKDPHPMIKSVNAPPIFSLARVIEVRPDPAKSITVRPVLATGGEGWATAEATMPRAGEGQFVEGRDVSGPVPIAGEITIGSGENMGRILIFGDSDLANNGLIEQGGNKDLFINAINWLSEDVEQMASRPAAQIMGKNQMILSQQEGGTILFLSTGLMPGIFLLLGIGIFLWRRRQRT